MDAMIHTQQKGENMEKKWHENNQHIDWNACLKIANQNETNALKLLSMFIKDLPQARNDINKAYNEQDNLALKASAHKLLGASCYCGAKTIQNVLNNIGQDINTNNWESIHKHMQSFNNIVSELMAYYRENAF